MRTICKSSTALLLLMYEQGDSSHILFSFYSAFCVLYRNTLTVGISHSVSGFSPTTTLRLPVTQSSELSPRHRAQLSVFVIPHALRLFTRRSTPISGRRRYRHPNKSYHYPTSLEMDPTTQLCHKLNAERTHQSLRQQPTPPEMAPPPYTPSDTDSEPDDDEERDTSSPLKLTINAAHSIQGSNNLVPTSPTPLADATRFSTILLAAVNQINNAATEGKAKGPLRVDLTINCGITVIGDRNVVGNVGLKPKPAAQATAGPGATLASQPVNAVAGAKRKVEDVDGVEQSQPKRTAGRE